MAACGRRSLVLAQMSKRFAVGPCCIHVRHQHKEKIITAGSQWRLKRGKEEAGNRSGPLADIPDWSYTDGRPSPLMRSQLKRKEKQKELAHKIVNLMNEMKFAKDLYQQHLMEEQDTKETLIREKLKNKVDT